MNRKVKHLFVSGGTLPLDSESYIERRADRELLDHLLAGNFAYVLNARQMGKSSLCVRTRSKLEACGVQTVFIDLTQFGGRNSQPNQWYAGLANAVGVALNLTDPILDYYGIQVDQSPVARFFGALRDVALKQIAGPIVIFIDEIDATRNLPFDTDEFFAAIRECFNRRVRDEDMRRLTFCLIGVAVPNDLIKNPVTTPFNIGERIRLDDFTGEEVRTYSQFFGPSGRTLADRIHYWTNGQPFLTQAIAQVVVAGGIQTEAGVDSAVEQSFFEPGALITNPNLSDVAKRALNDPEPDVPADKFRANLLSAYDRGLRGKRVKDDDASRVSVVLKLSGLMRKEGDRLVVRNRIYDRVFDRTWVQEHMPGQEQLRQRQSFRRGLIRGGAAAFAAIGIFGALGIYALEKGVLARRAEAKAVAAENRLDYQLYVSDMNRLRLFDETGNGAGMSAVLARWKDSPHRGFEWSFWMGRLHDGLEEYSLDYEASGKRESGLLTPDGGQICIQDSLKNIAVLFDRQTRRPIGSTGLADGRLYATSRGILKIAIRRQPASVTELATGRVVGRIGSPGHRYVFSGPVASDFALVRDVSGKGESDRAMEVWDIVHGTLLFRRPAPRSLPANAYISKNGIRFCYAEAAVNPTQERSLVVYDRAANREIDRFAFPGPWKFAAMSSSGKLIAYLDGDGLPHVRDVDHHLPIFSAHGADEVTSVDFTSDERSMIWISTEGRATLRELPSGRSLGTWTDVWGLLPTSDPNFWFATARSARLMKITPHGLSVIGQADAVAQDGQGTLWLTQALGRPESRMSDPSFLPLPTLVMPPTARNFTYSRLWGSVRLGDRTQIVSTVGAPASAIYPQVFENFACGAGGDPVVGSNGKQLFGFKKEDSLPIWRRSVDPPAAAFWMTPDGRILVVGLSDGTILTIDPLTGKNLRQTGPATPGIRVLRFSRDGQKFVTGLARGDAIMWDVSSLRPLTEFHGNSGQAIQGVDVSPDGRRVVTCDVTGGWQIWDAATGQELTEIRASNLGLSSAVFTADGKKLVTAGVDRTVRVWPGLSNDPTIRIPLPAGN